MKSAFWRSLVVVAILAAPVMANAYDASIGSETAHNAMNGATLMNTTAVFNVFPHMVVNNGNGVELDTAFGSGFGRAWWEAHDGWWTSLTVGRSDLGAQGANYMWGGDNLTTLFPTSGPGSPFNDSMFMNLGIARATASGGAWSANLMLAPFGGNSFEDDTPNDFETNSTGYGASVSWGNGNGLDLQGEFGTQKVEDKDNLADVSTDESLLNFGLNARFENGNYIYQGSLIYADQSQGNNQNAPEPSSSQVGLLATVGRFIKNDVDGQATVEVGAAWLNQSGDDDGDPALEDSATLLGFPAVRVAAWEMISNRWGVQGGVTWGHIFTSAEFDPGNEKDSENFSDYTWSAGLFFQPKDNVRFDARFEENNLNQILSLGNDSPLVMFIGTTIGLN